MALQVYAGDFQEYPFNAQPGVAPIHDGNAYYEPYGRAPLWGWAPAPASATAARARPVTGATI